MKKKSVLLVLLLQCSTPYCNDFVLGKALLLLLFYTDNSYFKYHNFFQIFICKST